MSAKSWFTLETVNERNECTQLSLDAWIKTHYVTVRYLTVTSVKKSNNFWKKFRILPFIALVVTQWWSEPQYFSFIFFIRKGFKAMCIYKLPSWKSCMWERKLAPGISCRPCPPSVHSICPRGGCVTLRQFPVIEFVEQACVHCGEFLHAEVNFVKPFPVSIQQQSSYPAGDGGRVLSPGQVF